MATTEVSFMKLGFQKSFALLALVFAALGSSKAHALSLDEAWKTVQVIMEVPRSDEDRADRLSKKFMSDLLSEPEEFLETVTYVANQLPDRKDLSSLNIMRLRELELRVMVEVMVAKDRYQEISKWVSIGAGVVGAFIGMAKLKFVKKILRKIRPKKQKNEGDAELSPVTKYLMVGFWTAVGYVISDKGMALLVDPAIRNLDKRNLINLLDTQLEIHEIRETQ